MTSKCLSAAGIAKQILLWILSEDYPEQEITRSAAVKGLSNEVIGWWQGALNSKINLCNIYLIHVHIWFKGARMYFCFTLWEMIDFAYQLCLHLATRQQPSYSILFDKPSRKEPVHAKIWGIKC